MTHTSPTTQKPPLNVAFFHPDLGLGGAERLIADACISLQNYGAGKVVESETNEKSNLMPPSPAFMTQNSPRFADSHGTANPPDSQLVSQNHVCLYTSHHDPSRCFKETIDGTIRVFVEGMEWPRVFQIPIGFQTNETTGTRELRYRSLGHIFWATWRMVWCVMRVMQVLRNESNKDAPPSTKYQKRSAFAELIVYIVGVVFQLLLMIWIALCTVFEALVHVVAVRTTKPSTKERTKKGSSSQDNGAYHSPTKTASASACPMLGYDVYIVDQVPIAVPLLKYLAPLKPNGERPLILFYCHFPDKLLALNRDSRNPFRRIYRWIFDYIEEWSMRQADVILVNSKFTRDIFKDSFPSIRVTPQVLYPSLVEEAYDAIPGDFENSSLFPVYKGGKHVVASINRFERKKNHMLALKAFNELKHMLPDFKQKCHLVIAGGYDERLQENVEVKAELEEAADKMGLKGQVTFKPSFSDADRYLLLHMSAAVVYTPQNEHFGIVPVEAMYCMRPVVAVNNGGPTESIAHGETGFLCEPQAQTFAKALADILSDRQMARQMGESGRLRVKGMFSLRAFGEALDEYCRTEIFHGSNKKDE
uniref:Alpha-1,3/1,6-mannosyltransferase ALG2 n=1 Tax=Percolomonas cosmopolitus TaxID=63605 RepID=A0A7S1PIT9_9EUKA